MSIRLSYSSQYPFDIRHTSLLVYYLCIPTLMVDGVLGSGFHLTLGRSNEGRKEMVESLDLTNDETARYD